MVNWGERSPEAQAAELERLRQAVSTVAVERSSPEGDITVVVGAGAAVTAIEIEPAALRRPPAELAEAVKDTIDAAAYAAQMELGEQVAAITGGAIGFSVNPDPAPSWAELAADEKYQAPSPGSTPESELDARLERSLDTFRDQLDRYAAAAEAMTAALVTVSSDDLAVSVTVSGDGQLRRIDLDPAVLGGPAAELGPSILATMHRAMAAAATGHAARLHEIMGGRMDVRGMVADAIGDEPNERGL